MTKKVRSAIPGEPIPTYPLALRHPRGCSPWAQTHRPARTVNPATAEEMSGAIVAVALSHSPGLISRSSGFSGAYGR